MNQFQMAGPGMPARVPTSFPQPQPQGQQQQIINVIHARLQEQPPPQGWQVQLPRQQRAGTIMSLFTQLRLQPNPAQGNDMDKLRSAIQFERNCYLNAGSLDRYQTAIQERGRALHAARQNQAQQMGFNGQPQGMQMNNPGMMPNQPAFPQAAPTPNMSMQMPMQGNNPNMMGGPNAGMGGQGNNMNMNMLMQRQAQMGQPNPMMGMGMNQNENQNQNQAQPQGAPNRPMNSGPSMADLQQLAMNIRVQWERQGLAQGIREQMRQKVGPAKAQEMQNAGQDLATVAARHMASSQLQARAAQNAQPSGGQGPQAFPMNQTPSQFGMQPGMSNQGERGKQPGIDFASVLGQQAAAERSQASGDLVVPASNNQNFQGQLGRAMFPQNMGSMNAGGPPNGGPAPPANMTGSRPPSSFQSAQMPGGGMTQAPPNFNQPGPSQGQNPFGGQPNALTGQPGGLHMPGPSPAMPTLNRPMDMPGSQTPNRPNQPMPPRSHQPSPRPGAPANPPTNAPRMPGQPNLPDLTTPEGQAWVRKAHAQLTPDKQPQFLKMVQARAMYQQQQKAQGLNPQFAPPQQPQAGAQAQTFNQQGFNPGLRPQNLPNGMQQQPPNQNPALARPPSMNNGASVPMPQGAEQVMNSLPLPKDAISKSVPELDIPMGCENWSMLFDFLSKQPNALTLDSRRKLQDIRRQQFMMHVEQRKKQTAPGPASNLNQPMFTNDAPFVSVPPEKQNQAVFNELGGLIRSNILENNGSQHIRLKDISTQELQNFRQTNSANEDGIGRTSDAQARARIAMFKARQVAQKLQDQTFASQLFQAFTRANNLAAGGANQVPRPAPVTGPQAGNQGPVSNANEPPFGMVPGQTGIPPQNRQPGSGQSQALPAWATGRLQNGSIQQPNNSNIAQQQQQQQARMQEEMKKRALQATQSQATGPAQSQGPKVDASKLSPQQRQQRFADLIREAEKNTPRGAPTHLERLPRDPQLEKSLNYVKAVHEQRSTNYQALRAFYVQLGEEDNTKELLQALRILNNQIKPGVEPAQIETTSSASEINNHLFKVFKFKQLVTKMKNKNVGNAAAGAVNGSQGPAQSAATATVEASAQPSSQQDVKQAPTNATVKMEGNNAQQQAGHRTGIPQPDGSVQYFDQNKIKDFNLTLPASRIKQRMSQPPVGPAPSAAVPKQESEKPSVTPAPAAVQVDLPCKCSIPGCEYELPGFATSQEQQDHERTVHKYNGDPLRWCMGSLKESLGLNKPAALRRAAAARTQPLDNTLKPTMPQSTAMKRELSNRPSTPQSRAQTSALGPEQRPGSAAGIKRGASSVQGQNDTELGSPSKRSKPTPPRVDTWQHTEWSPELMQAVFAEIPRATLTDPLLGCNIPAFDGVDITPPEELIKQDGEEPQMSDEEHMQGLLDWVDPHTEELFSDVSGFGVDMTGLDTNKSLDDWFMVTPDMNMNSNPNEQITAEAVNDFLKTGKKFDPTNKEDMERVFGGGSKMNLNTGGV